MGMIARNTSADVNVIALVGERGREVLDFIERDLGPRGLGTLRRCRGNVRSTGFDPDEGRVDSNDNR
ncbi:hypothetical protein HMSSN139_59740 [Paenibacillus sp. HMSSN-139]|nr:hypothetical protein HMSSN139_59740 [Paenibacillus sp. HMSSN-139]